MHIGIDAKRIFFNNSGLGNYSRRFYKALVKNLPDDDFILYSPKTVTEDNLYLKESRAINTRIVTPPGFFNRMMNGSLWRSGLIKKQLINDKIDVYYGLSNEIPLRTRSLKMTKVVVIHDLIFLRYPELYPAIDRFFYMKKTEYACRHSDFIIAASGQTRQDIINYYKIPGEKIHVIYPGSEPMFYAETVTGSNDYFKPARPYIISIGAITPRKNLHKTVEAFHRVMDRYGLDLVVIGTAVGLGKKYLKEIKEFIERNGMADRVHFLGNVPYKYAPDLCRKAQMMIYPSRFEGFGMPIVEGLFSKIPVITSKGGCFPEAGGEGSVYIDPDNVSEISGWIEKLMESEKLRAEIIDKGTRHARRFRQDRIEQDISDFHQLVIRQSLLNS